MTTPHTAESHDDRAPALQPDAARRIAAARDRDWVDVRILNVEIETGSSSIPLDYRRVRASIHLGQLKPADVRVSLVRPSAFADEGPHDVWAVRLWSALSYHNGAYLFEGRVPERALAGSQRLELQVTPTGHGSGELPSVTASIGGRQSVAAPAERRADG